eukprot:Rmarinus@m.16241
MFSWWRRPCQLVFAFTLGFAANSDSLCASSTFSRLSLEDVRQSMASFANARDWNQYHTPRNILLALVGEIGELSELFQWRGECKPGLPDWSEQEKIHLGQELADCLLYLVRLSDRCGVDLSEAVVEKMRHNERKYPVDQCRGSSKKYTCYETEFTTESLKESEKGDKKK